jgi:X-X-X-Leu-X-X-Gly heptad repeat protein
MNTTNNSVINDREINEHEISKPDQTNSINSIPILLDYSSDNSSDTNEPNLKHLFNSDSDDSYQMIQPNQLSPIKPISNQLSPIKPISNQLSSRSNHLLSGSNQLLTRSNQLPSGSNQLLTRSNQLPYGSNQLSSGSNQLSSGSNQLSSGSNQLSSGSNQLLTRSNQLPSGSNQLPSGSNQLPSGSNQLPSGTQCTASAAIDIIDNFHSQLNQPSTNGIGGFNFKPSTDLVNTINTIENTNINGWDYDATLTITNWYKTFKQQSFIYQSVLDRNKKISNNLALISILSSALLGIFSGFKLWIGNDETFQTISNILLMLFNFIVGIITAASKSYIDDKRNEIIRAYVEQLDIFIGELSAQVLNSPIYRMNADEFFKSNNVKYTKLISSAPNLSLGEISEGKRQYILYSDHCYYRV